MTFPGPLMRAGRKLIAWRPKPLATLRLSAMLLMVLIVLTLYRTPNFIWSVPPLTLVAGALVTLALTVRRVRIAGALFYLAGAASLLWTLTPADTLLNTLWESMYISALGVGGSLSGFALLNAALLYLGLERTMLLDIFNVNQYFSGSLHYLAGAQGLLFLPLALSTAVRGSSKANRVAGFVVSAACLLLILNSGARAVYLPAALLLPLTVARLAVTKHQLQRALAVPLVALVLLLGLSAVLPVPTIWTPLGMKVSQTDGELIGEPDLPPPIEGSRPVVAEEGGIGSRLKMWEQTIRIGLTHPIGTGAGSFRNTIHAFQLHPLIGFSSPHNVFLETLSTGGWLRLLLLVILVGGSVWSGWNSERWPIAVGAAGIWATMAFDITGQMPAIMALAFWSLGTAHPVSSHGSHNFGYLRPALAGLVLITAVLVALWWYLPCKGAEECAVGRHRGYRPEVLAAVRDGNPATARSLADAAVQLNPASYWAWQVRAEVAESPIEELEVRRDLALRFPLASPDNYLAWASSALALEKTEEAESALKAGLSIFRPDLSPAGVPFGGRSNSYGEWLVTARRMLDSLEDQ